MQTTFGFTAFLLVLATLLPGRTAAAPPGLALSPSTFPDGQYGSTYKTQTIKVLGGKQPYTFSVTSGGLPPGLTLSKDGVLSGDPTTAGKFSFTVSVKDNSKDGGLTGSQDYTVVVDQARLTISANNASMSYGGAVPALTLSYAGFVNGDNASSLTTRPSLATAGNSSSRVGSYSITPSGAAASNYSIVYVSGTLTINPAALLVAAAAQTKEFGAPDPPLTYTASGFVNGDNTGILTGSLSRAPGENVGSYPITKGSLSGGANYTISYTGNSLTITAAPPGLGLSTTTFPNGAYGSGYTQTIKVNGGTQPYTFSVSAGSLPPGLTLSKDGVLSGTPIAAGNFSFTVTVHDNSKNGGLTVSQDYTVVVDQARLTISANNAAMTYGGAVPALTLSYAGFVNGDNASSLTTRPSITVSATSTSPAGNYPITASGAVSSNYNITYASGTLTVHPAALLVAAAAQTKEFGAPDPPLTYTASGFVNGENSGILTGSLSRAPGENVGSYPILKGSLSGGANYTISYTGNSLTITKVPQHINWTQSLLFGCNSTTQMQLTATASSGLPVTYSVSDANVATVSANELTLLHPGTAVITANQAGDANHAPATAVADTLVYQPASLIAQHWSDALFFDNSSGNFVEWQWYKNGNAVPGATDPYYSESPQLNGQYYVVATNRSGQEIQSCTVTITGSAAIPGGIKVQPNPANAASRATVTSNYSSDALRGAILELVDMNGRVREQVTTVQPSTPVIMPSQPGIYIINLLLAGGQKASTNVLVVN